MDLLAGMLPAVPIAALLLNARPPAGWRRYALTALAVIVMTIICQAYEVLFDRAQPSPSDVAGTLLISSLVLTACVYRGSARNAADTLLQRMIDAATLDNEVKRARLQLLRLQVEPHFLFNTLATVRILASTDRGAAVAMIDNLMRYLAEVLPHMQQDETVLSRELQLIDAYLRLYQVRMGSRLAYELAVPEDLSGERVPTMMLLTLVENALKHAVNPAVEGGFIRVSADREGSALVLRVADSGRGLSAQLGHGTGLANVRLRLMMLYGDEAILSLAPSSPHGVVASISIPAAAPA
jgi:LytS/YehU family sensor histidine kinase